jgi:penicillin-binding protein 2
MHANGLTNDQIEMVRKGMWRVVNDQGGTGAKARVPGVMVAGKTGTAQFWRDGEKDNHTWFIAFAPYEKPKIALAVLVQGAKAGGQVPAPIAAKIIEEILALDKGYNPGVGPLEPAVGNFKFVETINFKDSNLPSQLNPGNDEDDETADEMPDPEPDQQDQPDQSQGETHHRATKRRAAVVAEPDIRPEADSHASNSNNSQRPPAAQPARPAVEPAKRHNFFDFFKRKPKEESPSQQPPPEEKKKKRFFLF